MRPVCLLIMSAAENVRKIRIWPRSKASRTRVKLEENLSAKDIIKRHTRNQSELKLFDNPAINFHIARRQQILLTFCTFRGGI